MKWCINIIKFAKFTWSGQCVTCALGYQNEFGNENFIWLPDSNSYELSSALTSCIRPHIKRHSESRADNLKWWTLKQTQCIRNTKVRYFEMKSELCVWQCRIYMCWSAFTFALLAGNLSKYDIFDILSNPLWKTFPTHTFWHVWQPLICFANLISQTVVQNQRRGTLLLIYLWEGREKKLHSISYKLLTTCLSQLKIWKEKKREEIDKHTCRANQRRLKLTIRTRIKSQFVIFGWKWCVFQICRFPL